MLVGLGASATREVPFPPCAPERLGAAGSPPESLKKERNIASLADLGTDRKKMRKWRCDKCGMSTARLDGEATPLPSTWANSAEGRFCLTCRRDRAASAAVESAPSDSPLAVRAGLGRTALIEFEVSRTPDHTDGAIAKACRTSVSKVAKARSRLRLPDPPSQSASRQAQTEARG